MKLDKDALKKYLKLLKDSGRGVDFVNTYGIGATLINFAVYGMFILLFYTFAKIFFVKKRFTAGHYVPLVTDTKSAVAGRASGTRPAVCRVSQVMVTSES